MGDVDAIQVLQLRLDIAGGYPSGIQRQNLAIKTGKASLALLDEPGVKGAVSVSGNADLGFTKLTLDRFLARTVAAILRATGVSLSFFR